MTVKVLFFGAVADATGIRETRLELEPPSTAADAFGRILYIYPNLSGQGLFYAVNHEYATGTEALADCDELAIFTAVSGG
ncbi:MAG: MoaD/ThiS family protein [Pyrinomonadaceae bacterium]